MKKLVNKLKLFQGVFDGNTVYTGPLYVTVDVTDRCNRQCVCCPYHSSLLESPPSGEQTRTDVSLDIVEKLCDELQEMGTEKILLSGKGEPLLHPRIFDVISIAKSRGLNVCMLTNGLLLNESTVNSLLASRLDTLKISLWASSPEQYQQNYPEDNPANFSKIIDGIKLLRSFKTEKKSPTPSIALSHVINRTNFHTIERMVHLAQTIGCEQLFFSPVYSVGITAFASFLLNPDTKKLVYSSLKRIKKQLNACSIRHNIPQTLLTLRLEKSVEEKLPCYIAWYHSRINVKGQVFACHRCTTPLGRLDEQRFYEIWNNLPFRTFRKKGLIPGELTSMNTTCYCNSCCYVAYNWQVHQIFKWFLPWRHPGKRFWR